MDRRVGLVLCRGYWRIGSSRTPRTFADNERLVCNVFRHRSVPSPRMATEEIGGIGVSAHVQFLAALLILIAGRISVVFVLHRPFLPE